MLLEISLAVAAIGFLIHLYISWDFNYFKKLGISYMKPKPFFGNMGDVLMGFKNFFEFDLDTYQYFRSRGEKFGGYFEGRTPVLWIQDLDLIKAVMVKDFDHFINRRGLGLEEDKYFKNILFGSRDQHWKDLRVFTTPAFTSGKMKKVFWTMQECGDNLIEYLRESVESGKPVQMKDIFGKFTIDVVAAAAYGLQINTFKDPDNTFAKMSNELVDPGKVVNFFITLFFMVPNVAKYLGIPVIPDKPAKYFSELTLSTIKYREEHGIKRQDFLQMIADARKGELKDDDEEETTKTSAVKKGKPKFEMSDLQVICQGFQFFFAGYETLSNFLVFAAYELAVNQDVQDKLREEIQNAIEEHGGITYEALQKMVYLDMVLDEVSRIHPSLTRIDRTCTKEYNIPGTDIVIPRGTDVLFNLAGMSYDPEYYPNPTKFDPERFSKEEKAKRNPYCFLPFGTGPRSCIGNRFAMMEMKGILVKVLSTMRLVPCEKTQIPLKHATPQGLTKSEDGVWLKVEEI